MAKEQTDNLDLNVGTAPQTEPEKTQTDPAGKGDEKPQEIDWTKVDPASVPIGLIQQSEHFTGAVRNLRDDITTQRNHAQELAAANAQLVEERDAAGSDDPLDPLKDREPDDQVTIADLQGIRAQDRRKWEDDQSKKDRAAQVQTHNQRLTDSETQLRHDFPLEGDNAAPTGLDADTVLREAGNFLKANDPGLLRAFTQSRDPGRAIYDYARANVPSVHNRVQTIANNELVDKIKRGKIPAGAGGSPGPGEGDDESSVLFSILGMKPEDLLEDLRSTAEEEDFDFPDE